MVHHLSLAVFVVSSVCSGLPAKCLAAASEDYISFLQTKAQALKEDKIELLNELAEINVPALTGKRRSDVMCMLQDALEGSHGFLPVREGDQKNTSGGHSICAVVSNSGILSNYRYGQEIDEASVVIRFNEAPTAGYEEMVGSKETIRIVNEKVVHEFLGDRFGKLHTDPNIAKQMEPGPDYFLTCTVCGVGSKTIMQPKSFQELQQQAAAKDPSLHLFASDLTLESKFFAFMHKTYGIMARTPAGPTTGAIGMAVALNLCDEVRAYGMNDTPNSDNAENAPYHYYEADDPNKKVSEINSARRWHRSFDAERDLWRRLATNPLDEIVQDKIVLQGFSQCPCLAYAEDDETRTCSHVVAQPLDEDEPQDMEEPSATA